MDKIALVTLAVMVGLIALAFVSWTQINDRVNNAKTKEELRIACSGLSIQSAPVRCLDLNR